MQTACANDNASFAETDPADRCRAVRQARRRCWPPSPIAQALPLAVTEKLIDRGHRPAARPPDQPPRRSRRRLALQIAMGSRERATIDLVDQAGRTPDVQSFVGHLNQAERLIGLAAAARAGARPHGLLRMGRGRARRRAASPHLADGARRRPAGPEGHLRARRPARRGSSPAFRAAVDTFHTLEQEGGMPDAAAVPGAHAAAVPHPAAAGRRARTWTTWSTSSTASARS